ncbi:hypothetical protein KP509_13G071000 [Ceratopteris richardii]|nr:hypothetical protein KP509_13G071000 [Ceratopteris richardii]
MDYPGSVSSSPREASPSLANHGGTSIKSHASKHESGKRKNDNSVDTATCNYLSGPLSPSGATQSPCLHNQILKVREQEEHFSKAAEISPSHFPASCIKDLCSSSLRQRSRLGLRSGSEGFVQ